MIYSTESDIVPFVKGIVQSLQPYALANDVVLSFSSDRKKQPVFFQPYLLSQSAIQLICNMINLLPPKSKVKVSLLHSSENKRVKVQVENTGINLIHINVLSPNSNYLFTGSSLKSGTRYVLELTLENDSSEPADFEHSKHTSDNLPQFYKEIQKRLHSHFNQPEKIMESLEQRNPREAAFMQKINTLINVNLCNENFDSDTLCKAMFMSRTQLFRKMKSLVKQAPANYIRTFRLQKAKELLETSDLTVSEVAFRTGFLTINHFTKIFKNQYGIPPSIYRIHPNMQQTYK